MQLYRLHIREDTADPLQGVPILCEHDRWFAGSRKQALQRTQLAFGGCSRSRKLEKVLETTSFVRRIVQAR